VVRDQYVIELAQTTKRLLDEGNIDPSADEIAYAHFGRTVLGGAIEEDIRKRLGKIRTILEEDPQRGGYGLTVYLVSKGYYTLGYRHNPPQTKTEASQCLVVGRPRGSSKEEAQKGNPAVAGIRKYTGDDDLIWQELQRVSLRSAAGKEKKATDRILGEYEQGNLSATNGQNLFAEKERFAAPDHLAALTQMRTELEAPTKMGELEGEVLEGELVEE
jgi:hypothetical protein